MYRIGFISFKPFLNISMFAMNKFKENDETIGIKFWKRSNCNVKGFIPQKLIYHFKLFSFENFAANIAV